MRENEGGRVGESKRERETKFTAIRDMEKEGEGGRKGEEGREREGDH